MDTGECAARSRLKSITRFRPFWSCSRIAGQNRGRRRARLCPPTVHNEQSSCRDIALLQAWWHLPGVSGLAPLRCDSTWPVALPMTSNPKSVQNGQRSSPNLHAFGSQVQGRGQSMRSHRCPERPHQNRSRRPAFVEIAACLSSPRRQVANICDRM